MFESEHSTSPEIIYLPELEKRLADSDILYYQHPSLPNNSETPTDS